MSRPTTRSERGSHRSHRPRRSLAVDADRADGAARDGEAGRSARSGLIRRLIPTLYEDDHILAVDKPAGIDTGGLARQSTLGLLELLTGLRGCESLTPANRLSRYESGVLILAKNAAMLRHLRTGWRTARILQDYLIAVLGRPKAARVVIGAAPASSARVKADAARRKGPKERRRPAHSAPAQRDRSTVLTPLRAGSKRSLVRCRTYAPTTHALRAQIRSVGLRAVGDSLRTAGPARAVHPMTHLHLERVTLFHAAIKDKVTIKSPTDERYGAEVLEGGTDPLRPLRAAMVRRLPLLGDPETNSFRLLSGAVEDWPGLNVERFGDALLLEVVDPRRAVASALTAIARGYRDVLGVRAVYVKQSPGAKERPGSTDAAVDADSAAAGATLLIGTPVGDEVIAVEHGLRFLVRPSAGRSVGLFLDQRDNRARVRKLAADKDVLNLFAYTCGFSVAAAAGGARSTVSVDLAPASLEWGKANFERNGITGDRHSFVRSDAMTFLKRAAKRGESFDIIVLDPPSFAHGRRRGIDFSITRDLSALVAAASGVLRAGGHLLVSTNLRRISTPALRANVRLGAGERRCRVLETPRLPADFAMDPDHAKSILVRFD